MKNILEVIRHSSKELKKQSSEDITITVSTVYAKIKGAIAGKVVSRIDDALSYSVPGAWFTPAYKRGMWDGRIRLYKKRYQMFPTGFLKIVKKILDDNEIKYKVIDKRKKIIISLKMIKDLMGLPNIKLRPYQKKSVMIGLTKNQGVINLPTGTGKTIVINMIIFALNKVQNGTNKVLVVTSGISLLAQLKNEIEKFQKEPIGFIGGGIWDPKRITVASIDTLYKDIGSKRNTFSQDFSVIPTTKTHHLLASIDAVFLDEAHHAPANTFKAVTNAISNAPIRISTTATYKRSGGDDMLLDAVTGGVIYKKSLSWMIDHGYLAKPTIILMEYSEVTTENYDDNFRAVYAKAISGNERRNLLLANICQIFISYGLSAILFVNTIKQGQSIFDQLRDPSKVKFLRGADDQDITRKPVLREFMDGKIRAIIATEILNEGVDFPEANCGIRAGAQKFEGNIIQQLGRILRKCKNPLDMDINKKELQRVFWFDLCDMHNKILAKHSLERIKTYESEKAFDVKYVSTLAELKTVIGRRINDVKIIKDKTGTR